MIDVPPTSEVLVSEITTRRTEVLRHVEAACERSGRDPSTVRLIAVTKTFGLDIVRGAVAAGITDVAENRVQELDEKASVLPGQMGGGSIRWHLVGSLQRNKAKRAIELADEFHALDSLRLAREIDRRAAKAERVLPCFVQVNVSGEESKFGVKPDETIGFLKEVQGFDHIVVRGLMTLAAPAESPEELETTVRPQLRHLADLGRAIEDASGTAMRLSMGMSGDYEIAVEEGATDIRLGSVLFGPRPANGR